MIERLVVENFKSLRRVDLRLGRFNLLIGANASGKSNFLEVLRVLQGIGHGFTVNEILDGKPRSATTEVWDGVRGGSAKACFAGSAGSGSDEVTIEAHGRLADNDSRAWELRIAFSPAAGRVARERLRVGPNTVYDAAPAGNLPDSPTLSVCSHSDSPGRPLYPPLESARPVIGQLASDAMFGMSAFRALESARPVIGQLASETVYVPPDHVETAAEVAALLANAQRLDPSPPLLREYSRSLRVRRLGDHGEDFAALVRTICQDAGTKDAYLSWLRQLRPEEVDDVGTLKGAVGEPLFMLRENDVEFPAPVLSDGTLRFAAIAAVFLQPDTPGLMTIEEIENGIHANRLRLLVELLRSQAEVNGTQVFATTHSPAALAWLEEEEYRTTFFCKRDQSTGASAIRPLADVPYFQDAARNHPVSELLAEGWLEAAP